MHSGWRKGGVLWAGEVARLRSPGTQRCWVASGARRYKGQVYSSLRFIPRAAGGVLKRAGISSTATVQFRTHYYALHAASQQMNSSVSATELLGATAAPNIASEARHADDPAALLKCEHFNYFPPHT